MLRPFFALPFLAVALAACDGDTLVECDPPSSVLRASASSGRLSLPAPVAVWVTVVDSVTGEDLTLGASGAFVTGTFADSLRHDFPALLTAYGPAGRYSVVVQHPGYAAWGSDDIRVQPDRCGPETEEVTARLWRPGGAE